MAASSSSAMQHERKILILKSSDGDEFKIEESVAVQSVTIKNMTEDGYTLIPLPNVDSKTLINIIDYLKKHAEKIDSNKEEIKNFDNEFVKKSIKDLMELVTAANYLCIGGLIDLLCQSIANKIKNKSVNVVRKIFNITNDYTPEEEAAVRLEHEWAHEGESDNSVE